MLHSVITQFLRSVEWGALDYLLIDLPPGTGDVQLTLIQTVAVTGAVLVTTPSTVALADVRKAIQDAEASHMNKSKVGKLKKMAPSVEKSAATVKTAADANRLRALAGVLKNPSA